MYNSYFGFSGSPFENNLDPRFLFLSENHKEVLAALHYFLKKKKGFALVCGDIGTGKTMLLNVFINKLPASVHPIIISNPTFGEREILLYIARALGVEAKGKRILEVFDDVKEAMVKAEQGGTQFILIIDEAHLLSERSLERIRLLSNIETQNYKLLQILLIGQYELSHKLATSDMLPLRQRISVNRFLAPMTAAESIEYIDHRLQMVSSSFDVCFTPNCKDLIFKLTSGVPRSINQICDSAFLICKVEKLQKINRRILKKADKALRSDLIFTPKPAAREPVSTFRRYLKPALALGACVGFLVLLAVAGQRGFLGDRIQRLVQNLDRSGPPSASPLHTASNLAPHVVLETASTQPAKTVLAPAVGLNASTITTPGPALDGSEPGDPGSGVNVVDLSPRHGDGETRRHGDDGDTQSPRPRVPASPRLESTALGSGVGALPEPAGQTVEPGGLINAPQPPDDSEEPVQSSRTTGSQAPDFLPLIPEHQRVVVQKGDTLASIAAKFFPGNTIAGMKAILAASPEIRDANLIHPGQILTIPKLNSAGKTFELRDNQLFAPYGRFGSLELLQAAMIWLNQNRIKHVVVSSTEADGSTAYQVMLGGYSNKKDLEAAVEQVKSRR